MGTQDDYIATTGERWTKRLGYAVERAPGDAVGDAEIFAELRALRAQRDELLAALEEIECNGETNPRLCKFVARAAIAKAKGEA